MVRFLLVLVRIKTTHTYEALHLQCLTAGLDELRSFPIQIILWISHSIWKSVYYDTNRLILVKDNCKVLKTNQNFINREIWKYYPHVYHHDKKPYETKYLCKKRHRRKNRSRFKRAFRGVMALWNKITDFQWNGCGLNSEHLWKPVTVSFPFVPLTAQPWPQQSWGTCQEKTPKHEPSAWFLLIYIDL